MEGACRHTGLVAMSLPSHVGRIVLVHGVRTSSDTLSFLDRELSRKHDVVRVTLPGHAHRRHEPFNSAAALATVKDALPADGEPCVLVGHSLGGYVSLDFAARHPDRVAGLVLIGATTVPNPLFTIPLLAAYYGLRALPDGGHGLSARRARAKMPPEMAEAVIAAGFSSHVLHDVVAQRENFHPLEALASFPNPTLMMNGQVDHFRLHERAFVDATQAGQLVVVPGVGHYLPMVKAPLVAQHITTFVGTLATN